MFSKYDILYVCKKNYLNFSFASARVHNDYTFPTYYVINDVNCFYWNQYHKNQRYF